ncbi:MAG: hypothetical protein K2Q20_00150 [Phycisphaerales bacterium]|nr:hypothetical protein [Phycisphaerales bacterium]
MQDWSWSTPEPVLIGLTMRGHHPIRLGLTLQPDAFELWSGRNRMPGVQKRFMGAKLAAIAIEILDSACRRRHGQLLEAVPLCNGLLAVVRVPRCSESGLLDAVRLLTSRAARRELGWPTAESVFTKATWYRHLDDDAAIAAACERIRSLCGC